MKALARQGEWQAALKLFERMRAFAAQRSQAKESCAQGRPSGRNPDPGRGPPRGLLGSDAAPDDVSYMQAALICERQQLWDAVLKLQADAEAAGVRSTPRMLEAVLHAAEQLSVWSAADQVLLPANAVRHKIPLCVVAGRVLSSNVSAPKGKASALAGSVSMVLMFALRLKMLMSLSNS